MSPGCLPRKSVEGRRRHLHRPFVRRHGDHTLRCVPRRIGEKVTCFPFTRPSKYQRVGARIEAEAAMVA